MIKSKNKKAEVGVSSKSGHEKVGRPSEYKSEYGKQLIDHMKRGLSFDSFSAVIKVNRDTLYEWAKVHAEFSDAKNTAYAENLKFWEEEGIKGLWQEEGGPKLNSTIWIFNMKNRHRWRDSQDLKLETTGTTTAPQIIVTLPDNGRSATESKKDGQ